MRNVTRNRFPIKNFPVDPCLSPMWRVVLLEHRLKQQLSELVLFQQQRMSQTKTKRGTDHLTSLLRKYSVNLSRRLDISANKGLRCFNLLRQTKLQTGRSGHDRESQVHELINCRNRCSRARTELHGIQSEYLCV